MKLGLYAMEETALQNYLAATVGVDEAAVIARVDAVTLADLMKPKNCLTIMGDTAAIEVTGVLSRSGPSLIAKLFGFGGTAYGEISEALTTALADPSVKQIKLLVNSPGGQVDGCDELCQEIAAAGKKKKVTAENQGLMASAAYWLASAASSITATSATAETGSIGVIIAGWDSAESDKADGYKRIVVVSKNAPKKDQSGYDGAGLDALQDRVDALERIFVNRVASGRGVAAETVINRFGKGSLLIADDPDKDKDSALSVGMIDAVVNGFTAGASAPTNPASAGKTSEVSNMNLAQIMAENPHVVAEIEQIKKLAHAEGVAQAEGAIKARLEAAAPFIGSKEYPPSIGALAVDVALGKTDASALKAAVCAVDAVKEEKASAAAAAETPAATPPAAPTAAPKSEPGVLGSAAEIDAFVKGEV